MIKFGDKLRTLRQERKLTRAQLSKKINYGVSIIYYWETNEREPSLSAIKAIAIFFEVSADYLLGLEDEFGNKTY